MLMLIINQLNYMYNYFTHFFTRCHTMKIYFHDVCPELRTTDLKALANAESRGDQRGLNNLLGRDKNPSGSLQHHDILDYSQAFRQFHKSLSHW